MATEDQVKELVRQFIKERSAWIDNKTKAIHAGCSVDDDISVTLHNACGYPTASLIRAYSHPTKNWRPLHSTFDIELVRGDSNVRCSSGIPGNDLD